MLKGKIPSGIGSDQHALEVLYLSNNYLEGSIPSELGHLTALRELYLDDNALTGSVSDELENFLSSLETCNIGGRYGGNPDLKGIPLNYG